MQSHRIVLGLGEESLSMVVKEQLDRDGVGKVVGTALTRKMVTQRVMEQSATLVILGEMLVGEQEDDAEWLDLIEDIRKVDIGIRIVFFCKRPEDDIFLAKLATLMVTDIFNELKFPPGWTDQLKQPPKYAHAEKFLRKKEEALTDLRKRKQRPEETPEEILQKNLAPQPEPPTPAPAQPNETQPATKIIEKRVVEKEIVIEQVKIPPRSTVIISLFSGAGSSQLARILAEYIASLQVDVGIVESALVPPAWFEIINGWSILDNNKDNWRCWHSVIRAGEETPSWGDVLEVERVKYIARSTKHDSIYSEWSEQDTAYLLAYSRNMSVMFYDASTNFHDPREQIVLRSADRILVVGGYDVVRMEREFAKYEKALTPFLEKMIFVLNKSTPRLTRIHDAEIKNVYGIRKLFHVPALIPLVELYMEGGSFWKSSYVKEEQKQAMREVMDELAKAILGDEVVKKLHARKRGGIFQRIGNFFRAGEDDLDLDEGTA